MSKLNFEDWENIKLRIKTGESVRDIAKDYGVSHTAINKQLKLKSDEKVVKDEVKKIYTIANKINKNVEVIDNKTRKKLDVDKVKELLIYTVQTSLGLNAMLLKDLKEKPQDLDVQARIIGLSKLKLTLPDIFTWMEKYINLDEFKLTASETNNLLNVNENNKDVLKDMYLNAIKC